MDYAKDWVARREMISSAVFTHGRVKDPIAHCNRKAKRYGEVYKEAYGAAYEFVRSECLAVACDKVDEMLSNRYGWQTIQTMSNADIANFGRRLKSRD
jgi:hypothetical protein